jgi:peroxiredoxin
MKRLLLAFIAIAFISIASFAQSFTPIAIGSSVPMNDVKLKDVSGKEISLKDAAGKNGLLVMFSCNTCPYVIKNQDRTKEICEYAKANGYGVIIINSNEDLRSNEDSYDAMQKYAAEQGYKWNYVVDTDSKLANAFGATRTPENFLFNADGKLVYHGAIDDNPSDPSDVKEQFLRTALNENAAGKEVTKKESKSVGCSIKRRS